MNLVRCCAVTFILITKFLSGITCIPFDNGVDGQSVATAPEGNGTTTSPPEAPTSSDQADGSQQLTTPAPGHGHPPTESPGQSTDVEVFQHEGSTANASQVTKTSTEHIELDITSAESTKQYDYSFNSSDGTHTFTAKHGHKFTKLKKGEYTVKAFSEGAYPVKLVIGYSEHGDILLSSYTGESTNFVFSVLKDPAPSSAPSSNDVQTLSVATTTFTVISGEEYAGAIQQAASDDASETDAAMKDLTSLFNYAFNKNSKCTEVNYEDTTLWKHDISQHSDKFPTNVLLNTKTKILFIESEGNYQYYYSFINGEWRSIFGYTPRGIDVHRVSFNTINEHGLNVPMDADVYEFKESNHTSTFSFKPHAKCIKVFYAGDMLWKYNKFEHGDDYPSTVSLNVKTSVLMVDSPGKYRYVYTFYCGKWKSLFSYKSHLVEPVDASLLKIYTVNRDFTISENDRDKYFTNYLDSVVTFTFKNLAKCNEVTYDGKTVWKYSYREHRAIYPTSLTFNIKKSVLVVDSSKNYRYVYSHYDKKWRELPLGFKSWDLLLSNLSVVTLNQNWTESVNDRTTFTLESSSDFVSFKFHPSSKCIEVRYNGKAVWKYFLEYHVTYPTLARLNKKDSNLLIESSDRYRRLYEYRNGEWKLSPFGHRNSESVVSNLKIVTVDENGYQENNPEHYTVHHHSDLYTFKFNVDAKCAEVKYAGESVWKYNQIDHGDDFPTTVTLNTRTNLLTVESGKNYQSFYTYHNGKWNSIYGYRTKTLSEPIDPKNLSFYSPDSDGTLSEIELGKYNVQSSEDSVVYTFKRGVKCSLVNYNDDTAWRYDQPKHAGNYPTSVTLNIPKATIFVESFGRYKYFCSYTDKWKTSVETEGSDTTSVSSLSISGEDTEQMTPEDAEAPSATTEPETTEPETAEVQKPEDAKVPDTHTATPTPEPTPTSTQEPSAETKETTEDSQTFDLDINNKSSPNYSYSENSLLNLGTFRPKPAYHFKVITHKNVPIWQPQDKSQHSKKVEVDGIGLFASINNATLYLRSGMTKRFQKTGGVWKEITPFVDLNLKDDKTTDFYFYSKDPLKEIYNAKEQYSFKSVSDDKGLIWKATTFDDYFDKVEVIRGENHVKKIILNLSQGKKVFERPGKNKPWAEISVEQDKQAGTKTATNPYQKMFKIITQDPGDPSKTIENDTSSYDFIKRYKMYEFKFKDNVKCVEVKLHDKEFWKFGAASSDSGKAGQGSASESADSTISRYPKLLRIDLSKKSVTIVFHDDNSTTTCFDDSQWQDNFTIAPEFIEVNINGIHTSDNYSIAQYLDVSVFCAKQGYAFNIVKDDDVVIYETKDYKQSIAKFELEDNDASERKLELFFLNNTTKYFTKRAKTYNWAKARYIHYPWTESVKKSSITLKPLSDAKILILTDNPDDPNKPKENDSTQYQVTKGEAHEYKFEPGAKCIRVIYEYILVWQYDPEKESYGYPESIIFDIKREKVTIVFKNEIQDVYKYIDNKWKSEFFGKPTAVELDLNQKQSTDNVHYSNDSKAKTFTYTPKEGHVLNVVKHGDTEIWNTDKSSECSIMVSVEYSGSKADSLDHLIITLVNHAVKHFEFKNNSWVEFGPKTTEVPSQNLTGSSTDTEVTTVSTPALVPLEQADIKILTQDPTDPNKTKENDSAQYDFKKDNDVLEYEIKDGSKCVSLKYEETDVWKYDTALGEEGYPELIVVYLKTRTVYVDLKKVLKVYRLEDDGWKSVYNSEPKPIDLNIKNTSSNEQVEVSKENNIHTYTPKDNNIFNRVLKKNTKIWSTRDFTQYSFKVVVDSKNVTIHLLNGTAVETQTS